ncbi:MAG TPA: patatin-like phospholipase family protein [Symbiobacteriaceae bacterium]|nr:patatin-like phospholipase family protein [Symbiobacteriaceae bacterium]
MKVGLALGGGFARGMAHVGVLQALEQHAIPIDLVAGTSAGSLVGAMYCAGLDPWQMEQHVDKINWRSLVRLRLRRDGLLDAEGLERWILSMVGDLTFPELRMPFTVTATDLQAGTEVLLREGRVAQAVRASCAFPGIFLPVKLGEQTLVDGGLINPVPTRICREMGADLVIGVELGRSAGEQVAPRNLIHIVLGALSLVQRPLVASTLAEGDVVIQPELGSFSIWELERAREMIAEGRRAAEEAIPEILALMARHGRGETLGEPLSGQDSVLIAPKEPPQ